VTKKDGLKTSGTLLTHVASDPSAHYGAVNVPPFRMSTIVFPTYADYCKAEYGTTGYGRMGTPTSAAFEDGIAALEGAAGSVSTCSGLSAVATGLMAFTKAGDHVLMPDNMYGPGRRACDKILRRYGVEIEYYAPMIGEGIEKHFRKNTRVLHIETPGSFTYEVSDIGAMTAAAKKAGVRVTCDNSWGAGYFLKPLALGADVSIMSGTKYIAGHADAMLGVLSASEETLQDVRNAVVFMGICGGADELYLGLRGLRTLHVRMEQHQKSALDLARWLETHPAVKRVLHPAFPSCPGHENWKKYFTGASGTFAVILKETDKTRFADMLDHMRLFRMGFSWGGFESLLFPEQPGHVRTAEKWTEEGLLLRLHVGFEDVEDLKQDLEDGFKRIAR
jgi:cystathionine beta-lyase